MKKIMIIAIMVVALCSCKKTDTSPAGSVNCDISYKKSGKTYEIKSQTFAGTPEEIEAEKSRTISLMKAEGFTSINIHNCH